MEHGTLRYDTVILKGWIIITKHNISNNSYWFYSFHIFYLVLLTTTCTGCKLQYIVGEGSRDGKVGRVLTSHHCGQGSTQRPLSHVCWVCHLFSFLPWGIFLGSVFSSHSENQDYKFQFHLGYSSQEKPLCEIPTYLFIYLFYLQALSSCYKSV